MSRTWPAHSCDVFVSGGGAAGLVAAISMASKGLTVVCCTGESGVASPREDNRVTALLAPTVMYLDRLGIWPTIAAETVPLMGAAIIEAGGVHSRCPVRADFWAGDYAREDFGRIIQHQVLLEGLRAHAASLASLTLRPDVQTCGLVSRTRSAKLQLASGDRYAARLVIGADGRNSTIRTLCCIGVTTHTPDQAALTFNVKHRASHRNQTLEIHDRDGPFTLIPLPGVPSKTASSVVWMTKSQTVRAWQAADTAALAAAATERSSGALGKIDITSAVSSWPIFTQTAKRLTAERVVLIAEAAHVIPPIGAQGFNTSIADIATLAHCLEGADDPGSTAVLDSYVRRRRIAAALRVQAVNLLNHASMARGALTLELRQAMHAAIRRSGALQRLLVATMEGS